MSHSITGPHGTKFFYNSDCSGSVELHSGAKRMWVPTEDLVAFVGELVRARRISELEQATADELVGMRR